MLPYYGEFRLLKEAVDTLVDQTCEDWHLTILDDHYESPDAMIYFSKMKHEKITYIRHEKNLGVSQNFNFAVQNLKREYCVIMGYDDRLLPNFVQRALERIGNCDFYQPAVEIINKDGETYLPLGDRIKRLIRLKSGVYGGEILATSLCRGNWLYFPSILWRTSSIRKYSFNESYKTVQDVDLELSLISDGATLFVDDQVTFQYRRFSESVSSKEKSVNGARFKEEDQVYDEFADRFQRIGWRRAAASARMRITSRLHRLL